MRFVRSIIIVPVFLAMVAAVSLAQEPGVIRVESSLVIVPARVTDSSGRFVTGLRQQDFEVSENGVPQEIAAFSASESPFNVALLIDTSRSAMGSLDAMRKAATNFVKQLQPQDRVQIVTFDEKVNFLGEFTNDRRQLEKAIDKIKGSYLTRLYDAISATISQKLAPLRGRKAIVVFSDGVDTLSRDNTCSGTIDLISGSGVLIYVVQFNTFELRGTVEPTCTITPRIAADPYLNSLPERPRADLTRKLIGTLFLRGVAEQSGGKYLRADSAEYSQEAIAQIADELRNQYTLEYYSSNTRQDGATRSIRVRLKQGKYEVRARSGYRAKTEKSSP